MYEKITALYTNLYDANNAIGSLKNSGIKIACINTSEQGLHIGFSQLQKVRKFPGAVASTIVKLEIDVDQNSKDGALSAVEGSFGVID